MASSSNIYFNAGSVGIGSSAPAHTLDVSGSVSVSGSLISKIPVFYVYQAVAQTLSSGGPSKVSLDTTSFDNYGYWHADSRKYIPLIPGYYQVSCGVGSGTNSTSGGIIAAIYKNGLWYTQGNLATGNSVNTPCSTASTIMYLNGSSDYLELYYYGPGSSFGSPASYPGASQTFLTGHFISTGP